MGFGFLKSVSEWRGSRRTYPRQIRLGRRMGSAGNDTDTSVSFDPGSTESRPPISVITRTTVDDWEGECPHEPSILGSRIVLQCEIQLVNCPTEAPPVWLISGFVEAQARGEAQGTTVEQPERINGMRSNIIIL